MLHAARNRFTTIRRVEGWAALAAHYNALCVFTPKIVPDKGNAYASVADGFVVYTEAYCDAKIDANKRGASAEAAALRTLGLVAAHPAEIVPWGTAWRMYDAFDDSETCDESLLCAMQLVAHIEKHLPAYAGRARALLQAYRNLRGAFEREYRALPQAVFQGDLSAGSILLTPDGGFLGLRDFNHSGTDVILNELFCESCVCWSGEAEKDAERMQNQAEQAVLDRETAWRLALACEHYTFTEAEKSGVYTVFQYSLSIPQG